MTAVACAAAGAAYDSAAPPSGAYNTGQNAAWLGVEWVSEPQSEGEIARLAATLRRLQITNVFVYASYVKPDGSFNPTFALAADFLARIRLLAPGVSVQAWLGIPLRERGWWPFGVGGYVDLSVAGTRSELAQMCGYLTRAYGFDGVHLDPEPAPDGDESLLAFLDLVRRSVGPDKRISIATPRIRVLVPDGLPLPNGVPAWSGSFYREVARRADQVAVMTYDSGLPWRPLFRWWQREQVRRVSDVLVGLPTEVFIGVPTSEERTLTHCPSAENMRSGILGALDGLAATRRGVVTGLAIYPYWETDENEWAEYERLWLKTA